MTSDPQGPRSQRHAAPIAALLMLSSALAANGGEPGGDGPPPRPCANTVTADVVAFDTPIVWNKFGSLDPHGMMYALRRDVVSTGPQPWPPVDPPQLVAGRVRLRDDLRPRPLVLRVNEGDCLQVTFTNLLDPTQYFVDPNDPGQSTPRTRSASFHVVGMSLLDIQSQAGNIGNNADALAQPGDTKVYTFIAENEGAHLAQSLGALAGGEGDGGSMSHGLFGAVVVEPAGSIWRHSVSGRPLLDDDNSINSGTAYAIVHGFEEQMPPAHFMSAGPFREFVVIFHDEAHTEHANPRLDDEFWLHSVRDAFGINYGISGIGQIVLDALCAPDCRYEEAFLTSWANGDPALLPHYPDDPSNVWHSYMGDRVKIRNIHAGPKETHVFHLHAHQWVYTPKDQNSTYLDSQAIGPAASFTYDIAYGGSGNRNYTVGDSIFHCHLYPHFAQGMWGLWRVHDVYEDGTRLLPDGTPIPRVAPIPGQPLPLLPTDALPGYPFFIPGAAGEFPVAGFPGRFKPGHRPPQPPLDLANDAGLPRHVALRGQTTPGLDFVQEWVPGSMPNGLVVPPGGSIDFTTVTDNYVVLPQDGTDLEQNAMRFHASRDLPNPTNPEFGAVRSILWSDPTADPMPSDYLTSLSQVAFEVNGLDPAPGAPYANPCPPGSPERTYRATALDLDLVVNNTGWHDPQSRIVVLDDDVTATENGTRPTEPLFFRANSKDCITFYHTNKARHLTTRDAFQVETPTDTIGQHIHLVKFDVTSSDGSGNGWNYEDGTFASHEIAERLAAMNHTGGHPAATGSGELQTSTQRWWADPLLNGVGEDRTIRTVFTHDHFGPSTIQQHGYYSALVVEPEGSTWWNSLTGQQLGTRDSDGGPTSWRADIRTSDGPIREFCLAVADFAIVLDERGNPINPPGPEDGDPVPGDPGWAGPIFAGPNGERFTPEAVSAADPGTFLMNYRNDPIPLRIGDIPPNGSRFTNQVKNGPQGEMANVFSTAVHGRDPVTPLMTAYQGDDIQVRLIQGAHEESHAFDINRTLWQREVSVPNSGYTNTQHIGISEHFEMDFDALARNPRANWRRTDMIWTDRSEDGMWNGVWGLLRIFKQPGVLAEVGETLPQPLPGQSPQTTNVAAFDAQFGTAGSSWPCPTGAPVRTYNITALRATDVGASAGIVYNEMRRIHDETGILFVRNEDLDPAGNYTGRLEPLILRANAGDCLVVNLTNRLPALVPDNPDSDARMPPIVDLNVHGMKVGNSVGWSIDMVYADAAGPGGDGSYVGRNANRLVAPGATGQFKYWCGTMTMDDAGNVTPRKEEFGVCAIRSFGDVIKQASQGLVGALVVEPHDSRWYEPNDGTIADQIRVAYTGVQAVVYPPSGDPYHEYVVVQQDGLNHWHEGAPLPDVSDDPEDTGEKAFNYRTIPFWAQLGNQFLDPDDLNNVDLSHVLSGSNPDVPILNVGTGQQVVFRLTEPAGRARGHTFAVAGHNWHDERDNPLSPIIGQQQGHTIGGNWNLHFAQGAGGPERVRGDFLWRECASYQFSQGLWGLMRVGWTPMPPDPLMQQVSGGPTGQ
ncbi:MAG: copper oxidase [Planctomycetota bacterium]